MCKFTEEIYVYFYCWPEFALLLVCVIASVLATDDLVIVISKTGEMVCLQHCDGPVHTCPVVECPKMNSKRELENAGTPTGM